MRWRNYALLFVLGLLMAFGIAQLQSSPGYMDADYYYAGGLQLATGQGFTEPFLWNYLDNPDGLPHPSHAYWMPMASVLAALGMWLTRSIEFASAQLPFLLISALLPPLTASLSFSLTSRRDLAMTAGFFALFSGYYAPFLTTTDTFGIYMLLGVLFLLAMRIPNLWLKALAFGALSALMHLSRADGLMWLGIGGLYLLYSARKASRSLFSTFYSLLVILFGYFIVVSPWLLRNLSAFGSPLAPGGSQMLWLTRYSQIFAYPAGELTFQTWLSSGWSAILSARFDALALNLGTTLGVQGGVILLPLIVLGAWKLRQDERVQLGIFAWGLTFLVMTVVFPFAGSRGSYFHSGAALQTLWWALAPLGLEQTIGWVARRRRWHQKQAQRVFQVGLVGIALLLTGAILMGRVIGSDPREQAWGLSANRYVAVEKFLDSRDVAAQEIVIVSNPPGYFVATGRSAIIVPDGGVETVLAVAERYQAHYLILDEQSTTPALKIVFENPENYFDYLGVVDGEYIFFIE